MGPSFRILGSSRLTGGGKAQGKKGKHLTVLHAQDGHFVPM